MIDPKLEELVILARMGFENDLNRIIDDLDVSRTELARRVDASPAYVSKVLNGSTGNFTLGTMAKWARAIGAIVQIRLVQDGREVVRVVDYKTAGELDDKMAAELAVPQSADTVVIASVTALSDFKRNRAERYARRSETSFDYRDVDHG